MGYILYLVTNNLNGKTYAGITGRKLATRWNEHVCHAKNKKGDWAFYRAIRKYGAENFSMSIISEFETRDMVKQAEINYIEMHKPQYNSKPGGDGIGRIVTDEQRLNISLGHVGRTKYAKGWHHNDEAKEKFRELGHKNIDIFKEYSHLGPESSSKSVICLDDWLVFPSASAAARVYGVAKSAVIELCLKKRGRKTVGGFRFAYASEVL